MAFIELKIKTQRMGDWGISWGLLTPVLSKAHLRCPLSSATSVLMI